MNVCVCVLKNVFVLFYGGMPFNLLLTPFHTLLPSIMQEDCKVNKLQHFSAFPVIALVGCGFREWKSFEIIAAKRYKEEYQEPSLKS